MFPLPPPPPPHAPRHLQLPLIVPADIMQSFLKDCVMSQRNICVTLANPKHMQTYIIFSHVLPPQHLELPIRQLKNWNHLVTPF